MHKALVAIGAVAIVFTAGAVWGHGEGAREKVLHVPDIEPHVLVPGAEIKAVSGGMSTMVFNKFITGSEVPEHTHPSEQITYVVSGRLLFRVEGREYNLGAGDIIVVPSHALHGAKVLEPSYTIESMAPIRHDWAAFAR